MGVAALLRGRALMNYSRHAALVDARQGLTISGWTSRVRNAEREVWVLARTGKKRAHCVSFLFQSERPHMRVDVFNSDGTKRRLQPATNA
jgi:hypothetical protein